MSNQREEEMHVELSNMILKNGEAYPKKHGNWVRVNLSTGETLVMDSWNRAISLKSGVTECEYWTGFNGTKIFYYGSIFGNYESKATIEDYDNIIAKMKQTIAVNKSHPTLLP